MAAHLAIQRRRGRSEPTSLCSFPSNSGSPPGEAGHSRNAQISNLVTNHTKSPSPPVGEKPRTSLPIDVLATVDSSQYTNGSSITTGSGTPLCGSPSKSSVTSEWESEGRVEISMPADEDVQNYTGLIDELLAAADWKSVSAREIRQKLEKKLGRSLQDQKKAVTGLIEERYQVLGRPPLTGRLEIGNNSSQGCSSPTRRSRSDEHANAKDTAGETYQPPKSPRPQPVVIDLTGNPEDPEPAPSLSALQFTKPLGNKRKRKHSASDLNATQTDQDYQRYRRPRIKRRPPADDDPVLHRFEAPSSRVLLILEMVQLEISSGMHPKLTWSKSLSAWTDSMQMIVYKIGMLPSKDLGFVVQGKVRPIGLDAMPVYISPTVGAGGESVFQGSDIDGNTWEVSSGEFRDMLADPLARKYIGHVV